MILNRTGTLRLDIADDDLANGTIIHDDLGELCRLQVFPSWCNPHPLETAEIVLKAILPTAPAYIPNAAESRTASGERRAGSYNAPTDTISIYDHASRTPDEVAEILVHECGHASGHPRRTARWTVGEALPDAPVIFSGHDGEEARFEEAVASMTGHIVATRLGICCRWNLAPIHFLNHMTHLPVARLASVITEAQRGANYILNL